MAEINKNTRVQLLVPPSTQENFAREIRNQAVARGVQVADMAAEFVDRWRKMHETDALSGFNVLADWLEDAIKQGSNDLSEYLDRIDPAELAKIRANESAARDPQLAANAAAQGAVLDGSATVAEATEIPAPDVPVEAPASTAKTSKTK